MPSDREPFDPTDSQLTEAAWHRAHRDLTRPARRRAVRPIAARGQGRPEEEEPDPDNKVEWATNTLMLDRCKPATPGDRTPYPERFLGAKGGN